MRVLAVHPGPLMYTKIFLRLEPLGLELVAAAARECGHAVKLIDLQVENHSAFFRLIEAWRPDVIAFSCNYLANIPEIIDLAKAAKTKLPQTVICVGGHSASFIAKAIIEDGEGAVDCVLRGEGEAGMPLLLAAIEAGTDLAAVPGAVTASGEGPAPGFIHSLDDLLPARDLVRHRRKYFIGVLDPCASIEFSRGCPWDCSFCSAWTFYGRSYRLVSPERVIEDLRRIRSLGVHVAINLIADPDWDRERFRIVRDWCLEQPEIVNISVNTPYPGTESWLTEERRLQTRDYRLFDIQHAVLPTRLPLHEFYEELVTTQRAIYRKHIDWHDIRGVAGISARLLMRGQTNFVKSLFKLNSVYRPEVLLADHMKPVKYEIPLQPPAPTSETHEPVGGRSLYVHAPRGRAGRAIDAATERFVDETRM